MNNKMIQAIIGAPASGKGTRINVLLNHDNSYKVISISSLIKEAGIDTSNGQLVSDDIVENLLIKELNKSNGKIILDGFPRTAKQAEFLVSLGLDVKVLNIYLSNSEVLQRSGDRLICPKCNETYTKSNFKPSKDGIHCDKCKTELVVRTDEKMIQRRYDEYIKNLASITQVFSKNSIEVKTLDATLPPEAILNYIK